MPQHVKETKKKSDLRIKTFLSDLGKRAYQTAASGRSRMGDTVGRQGGGRPNARGQQRSILQDLYEQFQGAHDKANQANEDRYAQLIGGLEERRERGLGYLDQVGGQMRKDTIHQYRNLASDVGQNMVSSGLSGGSAAQVMQMGVGREKGEALNRLSEGLAMQRFNADMGLDMDRLQAIERREDVGPDYGMLAQLAQQIGSSQPQVGGGVYGGGLNFNTPQFAPASQAPIANIGVRRGGYPQQMQPSAGQVAGQQNGVPFVSAEQAWGQAYGVPQQQDPAAFNQMHANYWAKAKPQQWRPRGF